MKKPLSAPSDPASGEKIQSQGKLAYLFRRLSSSPLDALPEELPVYSREEVAPIAAQLLEGDDYPRAVERAHNLLQECDKQRRRNEAFHRSFDNTSLEHERKKAQSLPSREIKAMPPDQKWRLGFPVRFSEISKYALNETRAERARTKLLKWMEDIDGEWTPKMRTVWSKRLDGYKNLTLTAHHWDTPDEVCDCLKFLLRLSMTAKSPNGR